MTRTISKTQLIEKLAIILADPSGRKTEMRESVEMHGDGDNPITVMWKTIGEIQDDLELRYASAAEFADKLREVL